MVVPSPATMPVAKLRIDRPRTLDPIDADRSRPVTPEPGPGPTSRTPGTELIVTTSLLVGDEPGWLNPSIVTVSVTAGQSVAKGQKLLTLEAMKMEHSLLAPFDGIVAEINASEGEQVTEGALLARIEMAEVV